jgi:uncharacterized protein (DUF1697 family)
MSQLRTLFEAMEFSDVATFIASGNVVFSSSVKDASRLESQIAERLETSLGYGVDTFVRTTEEVAAIGSAKVFSEDGRAGVTIHVGFMKQQLTPEVARKFAAVRTDEDEFHVTGREYYWLCRVRTSDSKVWRRPEIKTLQLPTSTMRNMTSIRKLIGQHID